MISFAAWITLVAVVNFETVAQQFFGGTLGFDRVVKTSVAEREDAGAGHSSAALVAAIDRVVKRAILFAECSPNVGDRVGDRLVGNIESGICAPIARTSDANR